MKNNSVLQFVRYFKMEIALFLLITGSFGTIGPTFFHLHSSEDFAVCKKDSEGHPGFYQLVDNAAFQLPVCLENQSNHFHFVYVEDACLVCNIPYKTNFEIPETSGPGLFMVGEDTFLRVNSSFHFTVSVATAYNKGSPGS